MPFKALEYIELFIAREYWSNKFAWSLMLAEHTFYQNEDISISDEE